jgi:hypothetical protein
MILVSIEGVRRNFGENSAFHYTITLIDETGQRLFVFGIERQEALPIVAALHDLSLPRPQTINVMVDTLKLHGISSQVALRIAASEELETQPWRSCTHGQKPPHPNTYEREWERREAESHDHYLLHT